MVSPKNKRLKTLAIFSPGEQLYSETFIQAHRKLPFIIKYYYGGMLPTQLEGEESMGKFTAWQRIKKKFSKRFSYAEQALLTSLQEQKVDYVLAEYGPTACAVLKVLQYLQLPLTVHFHGYDASVTSLLEEYEAAYKEIFAYATRVIAVSNKMKEALINAGCPANKLIVSVYGPDPVFFKNHPLYQSQQFIAVGRFVEKKAPALTIKAFSKAASAYPGARLVMVGEGEMMESCKQLVAEAGLEEKVIFKGVQTIDEIRSLMEGSIAFVQHSVTAANGDAEGTPVAILEAQAAALPVLATNHAGIPEVVIENVTGLLVDEKDVEGMAANMRRMLAEDGLAERLGAAGRKRICENFTLEQHLESLTKAIIKSNSPATLIHS